jgi:hypothetical protein
MIRVPIKHWDNVLCCTCHEIFLELLDSFAIYCWYKFPLYIFFGTGNRIDVLIVFVPPCLMILFVSSSLPSVPEGFLLSA